MSLAERYTTPEAIALRIKQIKAERPMLAKTVNERKAMARIIFWLMIVSWLLGLWRPLLFLVSIALLLIHSGYTFRSIKNEAKLKALEWECEILSLGNAIGAVIAQRERIKNEQPQ